MNCQEAIERLPWWLNGSLEPEERREVEEHLAECASCREALKETRLAWEVYAQHIPTAALVAHAADEPPGGIDRMDPGLLERHLEDCPQCAAELEMARASRLLTEHDEVPLLVPREAAVPARRPSRERGWQAAALAAGLTGLVAMGGWMGTVHQLHRSEAELASVESEAPRLRGTTSAPAVEFNAPTAEISATVRRDAESREKHFLKAGSGHARLILDPLPSDTDREHAAELRDASGKVLATGPRLELNPAHYYSVDVDTDRLPLGDYTIEVYGIDGSTHKPLGRFSFTVK